MNFFIKRTKLICILTLLLFAGVALPATTINYFANKGVNRKKRISLFKGGVSFSPPVGFKPVAKNRLKRKLPTNANPLLILSNANQTGVITVEYDEDLNLESEKLTEIKKFVEGTFRASQSEWITSEIMERNERQWFYFEWKKD